MTSQTPHISAMTPSDLTGFEVTTVSTCAEHERLHWWAEEHGRCVVFELKYFVNLDDCETLRPQVATQRFCTSSKLERWDTRCWNLSSSHYLQSAEKAADALRWLSKVPAPSDHVGIGPLGNGCPSHKLFKNNTVPLSFSAVEALQRYLDKLHQ